MIRKLVRIKNVGRFSDFAVAGNQVMRKMTLLFGENGRGKTTIAAILRSLKSGDPGYIQERVTLGAGGTPEIEILLESGTTTFKGGTWSSSFDRLEIFDHRFISDNIHVGDSVQTHNTRNLATVILGKKGVEISERIRTGDQLARDKLELMKGLDKQLSMHRPAAMTLGTFIELPAYENIESLILEKTKELEAAKQASALKAQPLLTPIPVPALPSGFEEVLQTTLESVSSEAEARVRAHLAQEHFKDAEGWLSEGMAFYGSDTCPVCGQSLEGIDLIPAYQAYFSQAYNELRSRVGELDTALELSLGKGNVRAFQSGAAANSAASAFWRSLLTVQIPDVPSPEAFNSLRTDSLNEATRHLELKKASLLDRVMTDERLRDALNKLDSACSVLRGYNEAVQSINPMITLLKAKTASASILTTQGELERLKAIKNRHTDDITKKAELYRQAEIDRHKATEGKAAAQKELNDYSKAVVVKYQKRTNENLENFGTGFRIKGVKTAFPAGTPASNFGIEINSVVVEAGKIPDKPEPWFQSMLGAGDKSALALAFFFASLDEDPDKSSKILFLDDPFNSQDEQRRLETRRLIRQYAQECAQVIVSSHDPNFLRQVWDDETTSDIKCLKLKRKGKDDTTIEEWEIQSETKHPYLQLHEKLVAYCEGKKAWAPEDVIQKPRVLLEDYIRFRFPNAFGPKQWLGDMINCIRTCGSSHPMWNHLNDLETVNAFTSPGHHGSATTAHATHASEAEILKHVQKALKIVGNS